MIHSKNKRFAEYLAIVMLLLIALTAPLPAYSHGKKKKAVHHKPVHHKNCDLLKKRPLNLDYTEVYPEPNMKNLEMIGNVGQYGVDENDGKVLRILRYKNIASAVESRYGLPKGIILAMMAQESGGADGLPNGNDDGGIGNIHMQGSTASEFGLDTYHDCDDLVCKKHGRQLRKLIDEKKADKKQLVDYDDRFNPVLNLDAVGRMLAYHRCGPRIGGLNSNQTALCRYSGSYNYRKYSAGVEKYRRMLADKKYVRNVELKFNRLNKNLTINGKKADFKRYIAICQQQNVNYGLNKYITLGKYKG